MASRRIITSNLAHWDTHSPAVQVNDTLYISGQVGIDPETKTMVSGGVKEETRMALKRMGQLLKEVGADYKNVVKCTVLLNDMNDFQAMNEVYREFFAEKQPARAAYQVGKLPVNAQVEIEAIAIVGDIKDV